MMLKINVKQIKRNEASYLFYIFLGLSSKRFSNKLLFVHRVKKLIENLLN
jgi:hypothetical protein